jgi:hypothetical protein
MQSAAGKNPQGLSNEYFLSQVASGPEALFKQIKAKITERGSSIFRNSCSE